jgi:hypothetical protein
MQRNIGTIGTTQQQAIVYLQTHYGSRYDITGPSAPGGKWRAVYRETGQLLEEFSAEELLEEMRSHYQRQQGEEQQDHQGPPDLIA